MWLTRIVRSIIERTPNAPAHKAGTGQGAHRVGIGREGTIGNRVGDRAKNIPRK